PKTSKYQTLVAPRERSLQNAESLGVLRRRGSPQTALSSRPSDLRRFLLKKSGYPPEKARPNTSADARECIQPARWWGCRYHLRQIAERATLMTLAELRGEGAMRSMIIVAAAAAEMVSLPR